MPELLTLLVILVPIPVSFVSGFLIGRIARKPAPAPECARCANFLCIRCGLLLKHCKGHPEGTACGK